MDMLEKTWVITCGVGKSEEMFGGICVDREGIIISSSDNLSPIYLRGRCYSGSWRWLGIVHVQKNHGLAILKVLSEMQSDESDEVFQFFDLEGVEEQVERGVSVQGVLHRACTPFTSVFGRISRGFEVGGVVYPPLKDTGTIASGRGFCDPDEMWNGAVWCVKVGHVAVYCDDGDLDRLGNRKGSGMQINHLHPEIRVVQVQGLGYGDGCLGCPVFCGSGLLGVYLFDKDGYDYVMPKSYLLSFLRDGMRCAKKQKWKSLTPHQVFLLRRGASKFY